MTALAPLAVTRPARPYPGLRPFEAQEWSIFFGRDRMIDEVIERLVVNRLVLIHGASGSGKSSLVRAGIMPKLARQYQLHGKPWLTATMRPSGGPLWNLATELARLEGRPEDVPHIGAIVGAFGRRHATLGSVAGTIEGLAGKSLCLLVDQFEELFRFEKETSREEAELFVDLLSRAPIDGESVDLHVVVTMRSEFLGECARFAGLAELINRTQYLVPRLDDDAVLQAVRSPAQVFGGIVSEALAHRLIAQVRGREDELPLLQHGLMLMWNEAAQKPGPDGRFTLDGAQVEAAGGLAEALSAHADQVMEAVAPDDARKTIVENLFRDLTDINAEGSAIRRPRKVADLVAVTGAAREDVLKILDAFRAPGVSFLTPYWPAPLNDASIIDISHEALIRCWRRINFGEDSWLKREFDDGRAWRSLLSEAEAFAKNRGRVLSAAATQDRSKLYAARNEAWSRRYGGGWPLVGTLLKASRNAAARARWTSRIVIGALAGLSIGALALAYGTSMEWHEAEAQKKQGDVQREHLAVQNEFSRMLLDQMTKHNTACPQGIEGNQILIEKAIKAGENGNNGIYYLLGMMYYCNQGIPQDYAEAVYWYQRAAKGGDAGAMRNLGSLYEYGLGVQTDYAQALEWYMKAASAGDVSAMPNIGVMYALGQGVREDYAKAREWFEKAAALGNTAAMGNLGSLYKNGTGAAQDYAKAREWFEKAAALGNTSAMQNLGSLYKNGTGVAQDYAKAREWYEKAEAEGDLDAIIALGDLYENGQGVPQDYSQARRLYEKAAAAGNAGGMRNLGNLYTKGRGVLQDYTKARDWYDKAVAAGDLGATANIGVFYENGQGVPQDYAKARELYEKAANAGVAVGMRNLGVYYDTGKNGLQDYVKAREWYEKAAAAGDAGAMNNMGNLYENGHGVPQDYAKAREWYEKAAAAGDAGALSNIGFLYERGHGVAQDYAKAREWYEKAAAAGGAGAMRNLGYLHYIGRGVPQDYTKAREWYEKAAAAGDAGAMTNIGSLYENGEGVRQDYNKAIEWYKNAAAAGNAIAMRNLGVFYDNGRGVEQDYAKAREWYQKAIAAGDVGSFTNIGALYDNGHGVPQDYAQALEWYKKAASAGEAVAMRNIGNLYFNGQGLTKDDVKAHQWYVKAAAGGDAGSMANIGLLYENGYGVPQDHAKAWEWYEKAVAAGDAEALGSVSWNALLIRDFLRALSAAEEAHKLNSQALWSEINRAHALMYLGRAEEAKALYLSHLGEFVPESGNKAWQQVITKDFAEFRKNGLDNPLMKEIEAAFAAKKP